MFWAPYLEEPNLEISRDCLRTIDQFNAIIHGLGSYFDHIPCRKYVAYLTPYYFKQCARLLVTHSFAFAVMDIISGLGGVIASTTKSSGIRTSREF